MEHVGIGEDQVRATPDLRPVLARSVAVVDRVAKRLQSERGQLSCLVLGERLGRVEVEGPVAVVPGELVEDGQVEGQRLARRGAAGDDRIPLGCCLQRLELVRVERLDAGRGQGGLQLGRQGGGEADALGRLRCLEALGNQATVCPPRLDRVLPAHRGGEVAGARAHATSHSRRRRVAEALGGR